MTKLLKVLKFIWLLPATLLVWLFYVLPLWAGKEIQYSHRIEDEFILVFKNKIDPNSWYDKQWAKWGGWSGPCVYIYKKFQGSKSQMVNRVTEVHEVQHCKDQFNWGIFFYPAYAVSTGWILLSNLWKKKDNKRHSYLDNYFERKARAAAGQVVDVPRDQWPDGKKDYFPWL